MKQLVFSLFVIISIARLAYADDKSDITNRLRDQYPSTRITAVRESQISGVYEVIMGRNAAYTDDTGRYMIFGHLFDMQEQKDLTAVCPRRGRF